MDAERLTTKDRDALPAEHFAVPGKRKLPIHDVRHTKLAWDMVDRTQGLTPADRSAARARILRRAKELGIDTKDWHKMKAMTFIQSMALNISNDGDHPNKMPFSGVLTKLDEPSDYPPHGTDDRNIILTADAAEKAIESLLGMAVDFTSGFAGHDAQAKIGIITSAEVVGNEIVISGFVYSADFPEIAASIKALKSVLGFSFEAQRIEVADPGADILTITELTFTGAAILRKDKAAYQSTSLAASAADGDLVMNADELKVLLAEAIKPINDELAIMKAANKTLSDQLAAEQAKIEANKAVINKVEPYAASLESCAAAMEASGVGADPNSGHAVVLRRMAGEMRAEAALGKVPHSFRSSGYYAGAAAVAELRPSDEVEKAVTKALEANATKQAEKDAAAEKKITDAIAASAAATKDVSEKLAAAETKIADLTAGKRAASQSPDRKTLSPAITSILARASLTVPEGDGKLTIAQVDAALKPLNLDPVKRLEAKLSLEKAGLMAA